MSDKGQIRIGNYILGETLGTGTFGKVKSEDICLFKLFFGFAFFRLYSSY